LGFPRLALGRKPDRGPLDRQLRSRPLRRLHSLSSSAPPVPTKRESFPPGVATPQDPRSPAGGPFFSADTTLAPLEQPPRGWQPPSPEMGTPRIRFSLNWNIIAENYVVGDRSMPSRYAQSGEDPDERPLLTCSSDVLHPPFRWCGNYGDKPLWISCPAHCGPSHSPNGYSTSHHQSAQRTHCSRCNSGSRALHQRAISGHFEQRRATTWLRKKRNAPP
jgi:hypothetical protein